MSPLEVTLSWPAPELSPNSRTHYMVLHRAKKKAKEEANWSTRIAMGLNRPQFDAPIPVTLIAHPPKGWRTGDDDNFVARTKSILDGIAQALDINDRDFSIQPVQWADRTDKGKLIVRVGGE